MTAPQWGIGEEWDEVDRGLKELGIPTLGHHSRRDRKRSSSSSSNTDLNMDERRPRWSRKPSDLIPAQGRVLQLDEMEWWGSSDKVGRSPFDHIPDDLNGRTRKKVLFLTGESIGLRVDPFHADKRDVC